MRLLLLAILVLGVSCDSCLHLDCIPPHDSFQFTYVDSNGNDLLSGISPKYEIEDMQMYSIDVNNVEVFAYLQPNTGGDGTINVQLRYSTERSFLKVKGVVKDTLDFNFKITKTKCCGEVSKIDMITLNGVALAGNTPFEIVERD